MPIGDSGEVMRRTEFSVTVPPEPKPDQLAESPMPGHLVSSGASAGCSAFGVIVPTSVSPPEPPVAEPMITMSPTTTSPTMPTSHTHQRL